MRRFALESFGILFLSTLVFQVALSNSLNNNEEVSAAVNDKQSIPSDLICSTRHGTWYGDENDCTKFYVCIKGQPRLQQCPSGEYFDDSRKMCIPGTCSHASQRFVDDAKKPEGKHHHGKLKHALGMKKSKSDLCAEKKQGTYIPVKGDCQKFYVCLDSVPVEHACPKGQYFNAAERTCMTNDQNQCDGNHEENQHVKNVISNTPSHLRKAAPAKRGKLECFGKHGVFQPDPYDCRHFFACVNGWKIGQYCHPGEFFDTRSHTCRNDEHNVCSTYLFNQMFMEMEDSEESEEDDDEDELMIIDVTCLGREHGDFLPDEDDCTAYFVCSNGFAIPKQCPSSHFFDQSKQICRPSDGSCAPLETPVEPTELPIYLAPTDNSSICTGKHGIIVPDQKDCTSFYLCIYGRAHHDRCFDGEYFDSQKRHCTPNKGQCANADIPSNDKPSETNDDKEASNICNGYFDGAHLPNSASCNKFFVCIDGIPVPEQCSSGEFFDSIHGYCRPNQNGADSCSKTESDEGICQGKHGIHIEHPDDCRKYFLCVNGQALVHDCNINEYFNMRTGSCILDVDGKCTGIKIEQIELSQPKEDVDVSGSQQASGNSEKESPVSKDDQEERETVKELVKDTSKEPVEETPKKPLEETPKKPLEETLKEIFAEIPKKPVEEAPNKPVKETPKKPVKGPIKDDVHKRPEHVKEINKKPTALTSIPKCVSGVNEYVFYPNVNDGCRTFYECVHGEPIIHSCPIGFIFNAVLNICDVPDFVECTHTMHINEVRDPSCEGAISGVRYANYDNGCKSFYLCAHGNAIQTFCGEGLLYNPMMGVCDWATNVHCASTNTHEPLPVLKRHW
ncbi:unnamed protein product [Hermetia illucens]|uniref:Chitin-binding type-2 domain-containing protein n=1 Tax=Hermetia illucens TaxID=343691 RepID=A0A7R8UIA1_HERIL|nr:unnamed protein product [Hermetia illucens]